MSTDEVDVLVSDAIVGERVDRAVALLTARARSVVRAAIEAGAVAVDGAVVTRGSQLLGAGQRLRATLQIPDGAVAPDANVAVTIVVDDPDFLVVDKPALMAVHPGAGRTSGTLIAGVLARYPEVAALALTDEDAARPGVVHRLDLGTSGLLVIARTPRALAALRRQAASHSMARTYRALVEGTVAHARGVVDAPMGRSLERPTLMVVRASGRPAVTHYRRVRTLSEPRPLTELALSLETGRTHQIRVHLASIGHPVVNDTRYGHHRDTRLPAGRLFLHAAELSFAHPVTEEPVRATSALPTDLVEVLAGA